MTHQHNERTFRADDAHKLELPERARWLPPDEVLDRAGLAAGMTMADIGAGTGFFALPAAERVGATGRVFAVDLQPEMLELLAAKIRGRALPIEATQGTADRTGLAGRSVDLVLLANVWHEVDDRAAAAREAQRILRPGGRMVIVDWRDDVTPPPGPPKEHRIGAEAAESELRAGGWEVTSSGPVGHYSYMIVAAPR